MALPCVVSEEHFPFVSMEVLYKSQPMACICSLWYFFLEIEVGTPAIRSPIHRMTFVVIELPRHLYRCEVGQSFGCLPLQDILVQLSGKP